MLNFIYDAETMFSKTSIKVIEQNLILSNKHKFQYNEWDKYVPNCVF